jgi:hypothetical protein
LKAALFLAGVLPFCGCAANQVVPSDGKPGQVVAEKATALGAGFKAVTRSIVMPAGHWEGVGHFAYLYFKDRELCQCSSRSFSISPSGRFAVLVDGPSGRVRLFDSTTDNLRDVTKNNVGSPASFHWDEAGKMVTITFHQGLKNGYPDAAPLSVPLE